MAREDRDSQYGGGGGYRSEDNRSDRGQSFGAGNDRPDYTGADLGFEVTRQKELSNLVNNRDFDPFERFRNQQLGDIPITGIVGLGLNALRGPLQQGMTYNRNFFLENVLPSGKMLTEEEFSNLSNSQREGLYSDYMQARLSGQTDAYGNPLPQSDSDSNPLQNLLLQQGAFPTQPGPVVPMEQEPEGVVALYQQYLKNLGGNNNQMGILPVMPPKSEYYTGKDYGPKQDMAYTAVMPQPGMRYVYDEKGTRYSVPIEGIDLPNLGYL